MGEMSWTIGNMPKLEDRVIVKGHEGWWRVIHIDGPVLTLRHVGLAGLLAVQHLDNIEVPTNV